MARYPFPIGQLTKGFGPRPEFPANPFHKGIDFGVGPSNTPGTAVAAASGGVVLDRGWHPDIQHWVEIDHGDDRNGVQWTTRYHMMQDRDRPSIGTWVTEGETIGRIAPPGGITTGVHLHFEVHNKSVWTTNYGSAVDPQQNMQNIPNYEFEGEEVVPQYRTSHLSNLSIPAQSGEWQRPNIRPENEEYRKALVRGSRDGRVVWGEFALTIQGLPSGAVAHVRAGKFTGLSGSGDGYGAVTVTGRGGDSPVHVVAPFTAELEDGEQLGFQIQTGSSLSIGHIRGRALWVDKK